MRALLVEKTSTDLKRWLNRGSYLVEVAGDGEEALDFAKHYDFDVIVLNMSGWIQHARDLLLRLRLGRIRTPVIAITETSAPSDTIAALEGGAHDSLSFAVDRQEFLARADAIVRRSRGFAAPIIQVGSLCLSLNDRTVMVYERKVPLTPREYSILELLVMRKGSTINKEQFLNHLYGNLDEPEIKIIDVFMCKLRRKLAAAGATCSIGTVWGHGYILREPSGEPSSASPPSVVAASRLLAA